MVHADFALDVEPPTTLYLAEDDPALRDLLASVLRADGHEVRCFGDGAALIDHLRARAKSMHLAGAPDLIISDHRMPAATGLEALVALREMSGGVPFILLSAFVDDELRRAAQGHPTVIVLEKPCPIARLRSAVGVLLDGTSRSVAPPPRGG